MSFVDRLQRAREVLEQQERMSIRALGRELGCGAEELEEIVDELVDVQGVAARDGAVLVHVGKPRRATRFEPDLPRPATSPHLAGKIRQARAALEGERKQVTVLFADVQGSMELAERLDPEVWSAIMQRFYGILAEGVQRFEGYVDKFTGDGIMALFGAPIAHEDHAQRACYAALHLQTELARYATEVKREHGVGFSTRMGLNSGAVVVGGIGDDLAMSYTAQGHTVGLAQRMESLASPDTCYVSASTAALVEGYLRLEDLGEFRLKGVSAPIRVHRLAGQGSVTTRLDVSRARGLSRFVGRETDMATLEAALAEAQAGHGQVVGVVAAAGTGKSRLCFEFAARCRARGIAVNEGHAVAHGRNIPYLPMLEVFRAYFGITDRDDDATVREKIAGRLLLLDEAFRDLLPVVFEFHRVTDPEHPAPRMDPEAKQRQLFAVIRRVVQDPRAGATRVVAVLEDLHWFDPASEALLAQWVDAVAGSPSLLVVNFRPEYRADWMQKSYYRQLPLAPLGGDAIRDLLGDLLGDHPSTRGLADAIHARTGGNPFFTEEVVLGLIEAGNLEGTRGAYRLVTPIGKLEVPPVVHTLLGARIDRLDEREKQVLQTAAVIGREFAGPILRRVIDATARTPLSDGELEAALDALEAREFLFETALFPASVYAFKHPLTQEVALASQLQERRRRVHAAVAQAIEAAHADKLDEQAALLAHHCAEAGQPLAAAQWHARAARFVGRGDFAEGHRHWERARLLVRDAPDDPAAIRLGATACFQVVAVGALRLGFTEDEARAPFEEGLAWAARAGDPAFAGHLHQAMSVLYTQCVEIDSALAHAAEWERVARLLPDEEKRAMALWPTLGPLAMRGDLDTVRAHCRQQLEWTRDHPAWGLREWGMSVQVGAMWELAWIELHAGSFREARELLERGAGIARSLGDVEMEAACNVRLTIVAWRAADPDLGRAAAARAVELGERHGRVARAGGYQALGLQQVLDGQVEDGIRTIEYALSLCAEGARAQSFEVRVELAEALLAAGHVTRAREYGEEVLAASLGGGLRIVSIAAAVVLSAALRAATGLASGERIGELLDTADRLIAGTGACNLTAFVLLERAALAALRGDAGGHATHLRRAHDEFVRMGAPGRAYRAGAPPGSITGMVAASS